MPYLGLSDIPPLPELPFRPCIADLFQLPAMLPDDELQQLHLDAYEARHFHNAKGGIGSSMINRSRHMPTATHAWGTQLTQCHCGCRQSGFDLHRLETRGLYGVLIPLDRMMEAPNDAMFDLRHPHPREVAILNGLDPRYVSNDPSFTLRFEPGAVGQLASPIQSSWVMSNVLQQVHSHTGIGTAVIPKQVLAKLCIDLIESRFCVWEHQVVNEYNLRFMNEFLKMASNDQVLPVWPATCDTKEHPGTADQPTKVPFDAPSRSESDKPCNAGLPAPPFALPTEQCTAVDSQVPSTCIPVQSEVPGSSLRSEGFALPPEQCTDAFTGSEPPNETSSVFPGSALRVLQGNGYHNSDHHGDDLRIPNPAVSAENGIHGSLFPGSALGVLPECGEKRKSDFSDICPEGPKRLCPTIPSEPYGINGGINLFANPHAENKPTEVTTPSTTTGAGETLPCLEGQDFPEAVAPTIEPTTSTTAGADETLPCREGQDLPEAVTPTIDSTAEWTHPAVPKDELDIQIELRCESTEEVLVWIGIAGEDLTAVTCPIGSTVGQVTQAEANIGHTEHLKALTAVGSALSISSEVHDCQILVVRPVQHEGERCPLTRPGMQPPQLQHMPRTKALWHQQGWVAHDEMTFYLSSINRASQALTTDPLILHSDPRDQQALGSWILDAYNTAIDKDTDLTIGTACLWNNHWFPLLAQFDGERINLTTSTEAGTYIADLLDKAFDTAPPAIIAPLQQRVVPTTWPADCGFQTLAIILQAVHGDHQVVPMPVQEAIEWRVLFAQHLRNYFRHNDKMDSPLGGAPDFPRFHDLRSLLEEHGVDTSRSNGVTQQLFQTLGPATVHSVLNAPRPWKDLKIRATQHKIQLVSIGHNRRAQPTD